MIRAHFPRLQAMAAQHGVEMGSEPARLGVDTRPAHEASQFVAREAPASESAFHHAIYRAHFVEGRHIEDRDTLVQIASAVGGIDTARLEQTLIDGSYRSAVLDDEREAHASGIHAVPTLISRGRVVSTGFLPAADLGRALDQLG